MPGMRLDHLSFAAGPDGLAGTAQRIGGLLGKRLRRWGHAPAVRDPQHDPAAGRPHLPRGRRGARPPGLRQGAVRPGRAGPFRARRRLARLGRGGRRHRRRSSSGSGREAAAGNRHRPDGTELRWKQIGVNGLISDPQLPFFIAVVDPRPAAPEHRRRRRRLAGLPGDRRRPAAGQRVARRDRRGAAGGRQGRVGRAATARPASSPRSSRRPTAWSGI